MHAQTLDEEVKGAPAHSCASDRPAAVGRAAWNTAGQQRPSVLPAWGSLRCVVHGLPRVRGQAQKSSAVPGRPQLGLHASLHKTSPQAKEEGRELQTFLFSDQVSDNELHLSREWSREFVDVRGRERVGKG